MASQHTNISNNDKTEQQHHQSLNNSFENEAEPDLEAQKDKLQKRLKSKAKEYLDGDKDGFETKKSIMETDCGKTQFKKSVTFAEQTNMIPNIFSTPLINKCESISISQTSELKIYNDEKDNEVEVPLKSTILKKASERQLTPHPKSKSREVEDSDEDSSISQVSKCSINWNYIQSQGKGDNSPITKKTLYSEIDLKSQSDYKPRDLIRLSFSDLNDDKSIPSQSQILPKSCFSGNKLHPTSKLEDKTSMIEEEQEQESNDIEKSSLTNSLNQSKGKTLTNIQNTPKMSYQEENNTTCSIKEVLKEVSMIKNINNDVNILK